MRPTVFLILLLSTFSAMAQQSIIGRWNSGQENTVIEIKEIKGKWFDASFSPQSKNMEVTLTVGLISRKLSWKKIH